MSSLTGLIVLLFLLLIAAATVVWLTLTARERAARAAARREARREATPARRPRAATNNDAVRGAKAPRTHAPVDSGLVAPPGEAGVRVRPRRGGDDPFDRFLDPERRRRDD